MQVCISRFSNMKKESTGNLYLASGCSATPRLTRPHTRIQVRICKDKSAINEMPECSPQSIKGKGSTEWAATYKDESWKVYMSAPQAVSSSLAGASQSRKRGFLTSSSGVSGIFRRLDPAPLSTGIDLRDSWNQGACRRKSVQRELAACLEWSPGRAGTFQLLVCQLRILSFLRSRTCKQ